MKIEKKYSMKKTNNKTSLPFSLITLLLALLMGVYSNLNAQTGDIIPTACANATYNLVSNSTINFYDDGGPGGNCSTDVTGGGNYANAGCITTTTICAAPGESISADFVVFSMFGTASGFDWMVIYDGPTTAGTILFDNRAGAPQNPQGTNCTYDGSSLQFCSGTGCLTFEFFASSVVNRAGWDAVVTSIPSGSSASTIAIDPPTCAEDGKGTIINYDNSLTYIFSPAGPTINAAGEINNAVFGQTYTLGMGGNSCATISFQIDEQLVATISTPTAMCGIGDTQVLIGDPVGGTWTSSNTAVATIDASGELTSVGIGTTIITYESNGCIETTIVTVNSELTPLFTPIAAFCENTTPPVLPTTSTNGVSGTWSPAIVSNVAGTSTYTFTPVAGGCNTNQTMDISVESTPVFTLSGTPPSMCNLSDGTVTLLGLKNNTAYDIEYVDENGILFGPINVTSDASGNAIVPNLSNGEYSDFVVYLNGCVGTNNGTVTLLSPDVPSVDAGLYSVICEGESITLSANNPDGATITWDNGVVDGIAFSPSIGTLTYTATANLAGCIATDTMSIKVNPTPVVNAGNDVSVCKDEQVTLSGTGALTYTWDNGVVNGQPFTPVVGTTIYTVTGTNAFGCEGADQVSVEVTTVMDVDFVADYTEGCVPLTVNFTSLSADPGTCTYTLSNGAVLNSCNPMYTFDEPGCYDVTLNIDNILGCSGSQTKTSFICVEALPKASFVAKPSSLRTYDREVKFTNTSVGATTYEWAFGDGEFSVDKNPIHTYEIVKGINEYNVTLIAYTDFGCIDSVELNIPVEEEVIYFVPNTFTPDNSGLNDVFKPVFVSGFDPLKYHFTVFNRWGEIVFESFDSDYGWDGTYGVGKPGVVQDGVYVWTIVYQSDKSDKNYQINGQVNLLK